MTRLHSGHFANEARPITALLEARADIDHPDRMLIDQNGRSLTFGEVAEFTRNGASWLQAAGVSAGDVVAWQLPTGLEAVLVMLSLARLDVVQAPIIHIFRSNEVAAATAVSSADVLIVDNSTVNNVPKETNTKVVCLPELFLDVLDGYEVDNNSGASLAASKLEYSDRWIFFTSGSTGRPKGVVHSDNSLLAAAQGFADHTGMGSVVNDVGCVIFPVGHVGGIVYFCAAMLEGFPVFIAPPSPVDKLLPAMREHEVTLGGGSTAVYQMLINAATAENPRHVPTLRMLVGGGAPCPPIIHRRARSILGVPIVHAYGMTEAPMVCVERPTDSVGQLENTSGQPILGVQVRTARYTTGSPEGQVLGEGEVGEIEIRGEIVTSRYLDRDAWNRALTSDGWFRTGDCGFIRPDGRVVLTGRTKDLIIRKGENIAPQEIEDILTTHPLIDQIAVVGLPDTDRGELVCAVARRSARHPELSLVQLCAFLDDRGLMKHKWPEKLVYVDEYPLTGLGKVSKQALVKQISRSTPRS